MPSLSKTFGVQIRRGGKFFDVGRYSTMQQAFGRGLKLTSGTLAATFKLTGKGGIPKAPKGYRIKKEGGSILFIEKRGRRLSKLSEVLEIQASKNRAYKTPKLPTPKMPTIGGLFSSSKKKKKKGFLDFL